MTNTESIVEEALAEIARRDEIAEDVAADTYQTEWEPEFWAAHWHWVLDVLAGDRAVLKQHARTCRHCMEADCTCASNYADWSAEEIAKQSDDYGRDIRLPVYECSYCIEDMQYEEFCKWPCPDAARVLDRYVPDRS